MSRGVERVLKTIEEEKAQVKADVQKAVRELINLLKMKAERQAALLDEEG